MARVRFLPKMISGVILVTAIAPSYAQPTQIVAFGASLTQGLHLPSDEAYPAQLEAMLRARGFNVQITNAGVSGNTTSDLVGRLDSAAPPGTQIVILQTPSNDILQAHRRGERFNIAAYEANIAEIISRLRSRNIKVVLVALRGNYPHPAPGAMKCGGIYQTITPAEMLSDGTHLTAEGYHSVAARIEPCVIKFLRRK
jgi:acyl-CoA thioesterase I